MSKKMEISNPRASGDSLVDSRISTLAAQMNIDLTSPVGNRLDTAVHKTNQALSLVLQAGVLFLSVKAEMPHGVFESRLDGYGVSSQRASECMTIAKAVSLMDESMRAQFLELPKSKALELCRADPLVLEQLLEDGETDFKDLSVRDLRQRIRALEAEKANAQTAAETATLERNTLQDQLQQAIKPLRKSHRPLLVEDIQQETAVQLIGHDLAISRLQEQLHDATSLDGGALQEWAAAAQGTVFAAIVAAHAKTSALLQAAIDAGIAPTDYSGIAVTAALSDSGLDSVVNRAGELLRLEDYEKRLRAWQREQERPRGKGRPMAKPELGDA